jgi:hypothetical protein
MTETRWAGPGEAVVGCVNDRVVQSVLGRDHFVGISQKPWDSMS